MAVSRDLCLVVTDAISFNVLYRGQLEYLAKQGFRLTLICGGAAHEIDKLRERNVGRVIDLGLVREPHPWIDLLSLCRLIWHFLLNRYSTVLYTTPKAILLGSIAALLTLQGRRLAFFQGRVYENFRGLRRLVYRILDWLAVLCSHEVLFVSRSLMCEFVKDIPAAARKGTVLGSGSGNGVDMEAFSLKSISPDQLELLRRDLDIAPSDFVVVIVGRINFDKGIAEIADVIERVGSRDPKVRFLFVGSVENADAQRQLARLTSAESAIHVNFTQDITLYMALADLHLFLSHREGFGNVAVEAAALGIPTLAFDVVGVRDSVAEEVSGWRLRFGDTEAIAAKILELADSPIPTRTQFREARYWVEDNFSQEEVWRRHAAYLRGAIAGKRLCKSMEPPNSKF